ncbi:MAG: hypothetical protein Q4D90_07340 [bacterium]|nr:hypothetical protein [bacterium]
MRKTFSEKGYTIRSKGHKIRCKLACKRIFELGTCQIMSKNLSFKEKRTNCEYFEDCGLLGTSDARLATTEAERRPFHAEQSGIIGGKISFTPNI